jgi:hypothetical protein
MPKLTDPKNYTQYLIPFPGDMSETEVLVTASHYTIGEPVIWCMPALDGFYLVGYCDYDGIRQAMRDCKTWLASKPNWCPVPEEQLRKKFRVVET